MRLCLPYSLLLALTLTACGGGGASVSSLVADPVVAARSSATADEYAEQVRRPLAASNAAIERAKVALSKTSLPENAELQKSLEDVESAILDVSREQAFVNDYLKLFETMATDALKKETRIEKEKAQLQRDKDDLERRETVWQASMLIAVFTALAALVAVGVKYPLLKLDAQLKRIEIRERELELERALARRRVSEQPELGHDANDARTPNVS